MSNWLHISPTTGRGSTQMTISADTNQTTDIRRAKIIVTAGTLSKTIEVIQYPMAGDIMCTYNQAPTGVKLINTIGILDAVAISSEYGSVRLTGSSLNQLTANTVYTFSGQTPSQLTVNYYLNSNFNNTLTRDIFRDLDGLVSVSIMNKVNTLSESFYNNMNLERIDMYSGVTGYSAGDGYMVGASVAYMCPHLYEFTGDSPLVLNQNMLAYQNKIIGITLGSVSQVNIPNNITGLTYGLCEIPSGYPNTISDVTLPASLKTIDGHCFGNLNITGLSIPSSVTNMGLSVFSGCTQLTAITANNATCSAVTISPTTFYQIATGGTLYYPEGSDYSTWLSENEFYLGYYLWKDSRAVTLEISASTPSLTFDYNQIGIASGLSVTITSNLSGYTFQIEDDWIGISGTPASGDVVFTAYTLSMNTGTTRNGVINIIYNQEVVLSIAIAQLYYRENSVSINVNPTQLTFAPTASSSTYGQLVTVSSNVVYTYSASTNWISISGTPASGTTTIKVYPNSNNTGNDRNGFVFVNYSGTTYAVIEVKQTSAITANITVSPSSLLFASGETGSSSSKRITVSSNVIYTYSTNVGWLSVSGTPSIGTSYLSVYPTSSANTTRNAVINVNYEGQVVKTIQVVQEYNSTDTNVIRYAGAYYYAYQQTDTFSEIWVNVDQHPENITFSYQNASWITFGEPIYQSDSYAFLPYEFTQNTTGVYRKVEVSIYNKSVYVDTVIVEQGGLWLNPTSVTGTCWIENIFPDYFYAGIDGTNSGPYAISLEPVYGSYKIYKQNTGTITAITPYISSADDTQYVSPVRNDRLDVSIGYNNTTQGVASFVTTLMLIDATAPEGGFSSPYCISLWQNGNITTGKYISASTTNYVVSSAAQTLQVTVDGNVHFEWDFPYPHIFDYPHSFSAFNQHTITVTIPENTTGSQRSESFIVTKSRSTCEDGVTGWDTPSTLTITITQNA